MADRMSQEILADALRSEMDRYWTRFNIFAAVQVGAVIGLLSIIQILLLNRILLLSVLGLIITFSITGAISILRGHDLQRSIVYALAEVENSLPKSDRILEICRKHMRFPLFIGNHTCSFFAITCCFFWIMALVLVVVDGYSGIVLPVQ